MLLYLSEIYLQFAGLGQVLKWILVALSSIGTVAIFVILTDDGKNGSLNFKSEFVRVKASENTWLLSAYKKVVFMTIVVLLVGAVAPSESVITQIVHAPLVCAAK